MSIRKARLTKLVVLLIGLGLIVSLSRDIWRLLKAGDQIRLAEGRLEELEEKHRQLEGLKRYYQSEAFIEEEARNKLNMARPNETIVILPPNLDQLLGPKRKRLVLEIPNWQRWWRLFF